jgi:hypothetical protein
MENNKSVTAVEWLISKIEVNSNPSLTQKEMIGYIEQAKEIEKQQIIEACNAGLSGIPRSSKQYYNETFNLSSQDKP